MKLIDGKQVSTEIKQNIKVEVDNIIKNGGRQPHLVAVLVGHDGGSETYVKNKVKACETCGFKSTVLRFDSTITEDELLNEIHKLNNDSTVDGFIVQLPLPKHISEDKINAKFENGVLKITLPKAEKDKEKVTNIKID